MVVRFVVPKAAWLARVDEWLSRVCELLTPACELFNRA